MHQLQTSNPNPTVFHVSEDLQECYQASFVADEGEEVTVDVGFDPAVIKLTGNITGDPPFKGILHHRGWRAKTFSLPTLSESADPKNIAPAEVEIRSR